MEAIFESLTRAVEGTPMIAVGAAFVWGILSILLSPCHLASIPLIVAFIHGQGSLSTRRALGVSSLFAAGILVTIGIIGIITAAAGRLLGDVGVWANYLVAGIFFVFGLHLLNVIPMPGGPGQIKWQRKGLLAAFVMGLIFGIALGPCTFAFMAPMLGVTFKLASSRPVFSAVLLIVFGLGHCSVIALAGTFTQVVQKYLNWNEKSRGGQVLRGLCGALVIAAGLYLLWTA
ncbi:cytochrome c biogenesis CcdA family protein [Planctomycetota bacterium]